MSTSIPPAFAALTARRDGARGAQWIRTLPRLVEDLMRQWHCTPDGAPRHGQVGLVVPVIAPQGPAVIKVSPPIATNRGEAPVLRHLAGRSAVRLYRDDPGECALLLERADGPTPMATLSSNESVELLGDLARTLAVPFPDAPTTLAATAAEWLEEVEQRTRALPGLVSPPALRRARAAIELVADDRTATVLHGDLHEGNVLGSERQPWLVIDPKGWTGTAAYDGWTVALTRYPDLMTASDPAAVVRARLHRFAATARLDADLVIEIAHARAVSSLLYEVATSDDLLTPELLTSIVHGVD